jgi:putative ABC transport system ATP-binding protein
LLDKPTGGKVYINHIDVSGLEDEDLSYFRGKEIGFIFQSFHLVSSLSAIQNVMLPMTFYDVPKEERETRAKEAMERLGLGDRLDHLPSELSGGQRQRVAIARSLVNDPSILLADEPTGNLDSKSGEEVLKIFDELNAEGRTIITVTHDHNVAERSRRIIRIKDGMVESDTTGRKYIDEKKRK